MSSTFADLLGQFVQRSLYSHSQLASLSGVPKNTITNWLGGRVRKPQQWEAVLKLADALSLSAAETSRLLQSAGHQPLAQLREAYADLADKQPLFTAWSPSTTSAPFQAVPDLPYFVGRTRLLAELETVLQQSPLVGLHGMGGVGKSTLAARLAYIHRSRFPDGVLWARLDASSDMAILTALAGSYGVDVSRYDTVASRSAVVRGLLADKRALLVLDNAESSDQVIPLLPPTTGRCRVLVTTRYDLTVLDGWPLLTVRPFSAQTNDALALFRHFLGETAIKQHQELAQIARLVGHLPLALAIAAAQIARQGTAVDTLLETLQQEAQRLNSIQRENRGVRLTFDSSYTQLPAAQQRFFAALGAFGGDSFTAEAAGFVAQTDSQHLQTLIGLSLVQNAGNGRFRLHPLLRDYAREMLGAATDEVNGRMCRYYIQLITTKSASRAVSPAIVVDEISNLHAAMQAARHNQQYETLFDAIRAFFLPLFEYGVWQEIEEHILALQTYAEQAANFDTVAELLTLRSKLHWWRGQDGSSLAQQAVQLAHQAEEPHLIADALRELGAWLNRTNRLAEAETMLRHSLSLAEMIDDQPKVVSALNNLGHSLLNQNRIDEAQPVLQRGLQLAEQIGYYRAYVILAGNLGTLYAEKLGEWETAVRYFEQGAQIGREHDCRTALMGLLGEWGYQALFFDELEMAERCFADSLQIARENGHLVSVAVRLADLGEVARRRGAWQQAQQQLGEGLRLAQQEGMEMWEPIIHFRLALLAQQREKWETSDFHYQTASQTRHRLHRAYDREVALIERNWQAVS